MITDFPLLYFLGVFVLVGMTTLLPWNFFISLTNFWDYKFRNVSEIAKTNGSTAKTDLQKEFTSYLSISSTVPNATFVIINALGTIHILRKDVYKGQIISNCLFGVFNFFQKMNENISHTSKNE